MDSKLLIALLILAGLLYFRGQKVENEETWEWTDYRGQKRSITVHRNVRAG